MLDPQGHIIGCPLPSPGLAQRGAPSATLSLAWQGTDLLPLVLVGR